MGAAGSIETSTLVNINNFSFIKEQYESKVKEGADDEEIFNHVVDLISNLTISTIPTFTIIENHPNNNCTEEIAQKSKLNLLNKQGHPLWNTKNILANAIKEKTKDIFPNCNYEISYLAPVVTIHDNFDYLTIPPSHYSRRPTDVYYINDDKLLRTHLTAHLKSLLNEGKKIYVIAGDVYRRLEPDEFNDELSHQVEFVGIVEASKLQEDINIFGQSLVHSIVSSILKESKFRWEENDELPYINNTLFELQAQYNQQPIGVAKFGVFTTEFLDCNNLGSHVGFLITFDVDHITMVLNTIEST